MDIENDQIYLDVSFDNVGFNILKEMQRYDDFVTVMKCIRERILTENIALHLLLDIGNFY
jgi:hypothetical protein